jgi:hypothetical protein
VLGLLNFLEYLNGQSATVHFPTWTGDCVETAKSWITGRQLEHDSYCSKDVLEGDEPYLPTKLLYLVTILQINFVCKKRLPRILMFQISNTSHSALPQHERTISSPKTDIGQER